MSALFFKRFLQRPWQIASIVPSSKALVERVSSKIDFDRARVIAEYGPGEGVHSREIARRMRPDAQLLLFELDPAFSRDLERQFADDPRVHVINLDAARLPQELKAPRHSALRLHSFRHSVQHSQDRQETGAPAKNLRCARAGRQFHHLSGDERAETARHRF